MDPNQLDMPSYYPYKDQYTKDLFDKLMLKIDGLVAIEVSHIPHSITQAEIEVRENRRLALELARREIRHTFGDPITSLINKD